jgi:DNA-binding protein HU-beta
VRREEALVVNSWTCREKGGWSMTKPEMVSMIAEKADMTKKSAAKFLAAFVGAIRSSLQKRNGRIRISDLGTFRVIEMKPRKGVNPRTGRKMTIPAMRLPRFSASKALKEAARAQR